MVNIYTENQQCKQGDTALLIFQLLDEEGAIISNLRKFSVDAILSSERSVFRKYQYRPNAADNSLQIDASGFLALSLTGDDTASMSGEYFIELQITSTTTTIHMHKSFAIEVIPSTHQI